MRYSIARCADDENGYVPGMALSEYRSKRRSGVLVKRKDEDADARRDPMSSQPASVLSGRTLDALS